MLFISMGARNEQNNHIDMANEYFQIHEYRKKNNLMEHFYINSIHFICLFGSI